MDFAESSSEGSIDMPRSEIKEQLIAEQRLKNLQINTEPFEREAMSTPETDEKRTMSARVLQVIKEQIQPRLDRAVLSSDNSKPLVVATGFSQDMFEWCVHLLRERF